MSGRLLETSDIAHIERSLNVSLPHAYVEFLTATRVGSVLDGTEVLDDAKVIVEATELYRQGFDGLRRWPKELVHVGDQADACPYAVNCTTGEVMQTEKGNLDRPPLHRWPSFDAFTSSLESDIPSPDVSPVVARILDWLPGIALVVVFVVMPLLAYGLRTLFRWLFA